MDSIEPLRMAAIRARLGEPVGSDQLIAAALDAVTAGVPGTAIARLAGLGRREEPEAPELFEQVVTELDLAPTLPADLVAARWELIRWWCRLIIGGQLRPEVGGRLVWSHGWEELDCPASLQPLVGWVSEWEDWTEGWGVPRDFYRERIIEAATLLLMPRTPAPEKTTADE